MDPHYYTRIAMVGWVFTAVIIGSLWGSGNPQWANLVQLFQQQGSSFANVILGVIVGISAPPAIGFLLERVVSMILWFLKRNMWVYSSTTTFASSLANVLEKESIVFDRKSGAASFHVFFYTFADAKLLDWARRRRTQMYASLTSVLAIGLALLFAAFIFQAFSWSICLVCIIVAIILTLHAVREADIHEQVISAWVKTLGNAAIIKFTSDITEKNKTTSDK
ncbi:MAG: hypothetical protein KDE56_00590 [Anaerolineales bacterium]|nr:hypothetical protein [Anaerolineales bacterium]